MNIYTPYTYLIGWSNHNKWYYGVRWGKKCNPSELWISYFTSSKYVKEFREKHGEPDVIDIRKTFNHSKNARLWEHKVLRRLNVTSSDIWLNKSDGLTWDGIRGAPIHPTKNKTYEKVYNKKKCLNIKKRQSKSAKSWWNSEDGLARKQYLIENPNPKFTTRGTTHKNKIVDTYIVNCEFCDKVVEFTMTYSKRGLKKTCGSKSCAAKWSNKYKGVARNRQPPKKIACFYCDKDVDPGNYKQWHGDRCKFKS